MRPRSLVLAVGVAVLSALAAQPPSPALVSEGELQPAAEPEATFVATPVDLGTLGGASSWATAVDSSVVVGVSDTASGRRHAFAYDLAAPDPHMIDLGTLGGRTSRATDVDGRRVVGWSRRADGSRGLFVYDLDAADPHLVDLGLEHIDLHTVRGQPSAGPFISGDLVVANSGAGFAADAFVVDLSAGTAVARKVGDFGGSSTYALDVQDGRVVGFSELRNGVGHAFVYDTTVDPPRLTDLHRFGGESWATALDGDLVVGRHPGWIARLGGAKPAVERVEGLPADVDGDIIAGDYRIDGTSRPFVLDLSTAGGPTTLPTLRRSPYSDFDHVIGLSDPFVIGRSYTPDGYISAVAYDVSGPSPRMTVLDPLTGTEGYPADIDGNLVVGGSMFGTSRATVWRLEYTTGPVVEFARSWYSTSESEGSMTVRVVRQGDASGTATVDYSTRQTDYSTPVDIPAAAGTLTFLPGERVKTVDVPVRDDERTEPAEQSAVLRLTSPSGALLGVRRTTGLRLVESDLRPDLLVRRVDQSRYAGDDVYNATGRGQTRRASTRAGGSQRFDLRVCMDPSTGGWFPPTPVFLHADGSDPRTRVRYFLDGRSVTRQLRSPSGLRLRVPYECRVLMARIDADADAVVGVRHVAGLTAVWDVDGRWVDRVRAVVEVVR